MKVALICGMLLIGGWLLLITDVWVSEDHEHKEEPTAWEDMGMQDERDYTAVLRELGEPIRLKSTKDIR